MKPTRITIYKIGGGMYLNNYESAYRPMPNVSAIEELFAYLKKVIKPATRVSQYLQNRELIEEARFALIREPQGHFEYSYNSEFDYDRISPSPHFGLIEPFLDYFISSYSKEDLFLDNLIKYDYDYDHDHKLTVQQLFELVGLEVTKDFQLDFPLTTCCSLIVSKKRINRKLVQDLSQDYETKRIIEHLIDQYQAYITK